MSTKEIDRGELIRRVREKRLTQAKAAALMRLSVRQVKRLCRLFKDNGLAGLSLRSTSIALILHDAASMLCV